MKIETRGRKKGNTVKKTFWIDKDVVEFLRQFGNKQGEHISNTYKRTKAFREFKRGVGYE